MSFQYEKLRLLLGKNEVCDYHVWSRDSGNVVIVVINDECYAACEKSKEQLTFETIAHLLLDKQTFLSDARVISFLPLKENQERADQMLMSMKEWFNRITGLDTRICFLVDTLCGPLVDALYGIDNLYDAEKFLDASQDNTDGFFLAAPRMIKELRSSFQYEKIQIPVPLGKDEVCDYHVWSRDSGNVVIVVIDDECYAASLPPGTVSPEVSILPRLREQAFILPDVRAIGFFPLAADTTSTDKVLLHVQSWCKRITTPDTRVYFLVDIVASDETDVAARHTKKQLTKLHSHPPNHIKNLTRAGSSGVEALDPDRDIIKIVESVFIRDHEMFSPKLIAFLSIGLHEDEIINDAIQFYAKAWETSWQVKGWHHDELKNKCSDHSKALADWLGIGVNDLCNWQEGESAKSLMMWVGDTLWTDSRQMQGKVLNAVLKKLLPPTAICPIPDEPINMPCTPCFPFLVSLRSFLLRCEQEGAAVSEIKFIQENDKCTLRLMIKLKNPKKFEKRFRKTHCEHKKSPPVEHTFTRPLIYLIYCMTEGLPNDTRRDYLRLFTDGTKNPVVKVKINEDYIDLIW